MISNALFVGGPESDPLDTWTWSPTPYCSLWVMTHRPSWSVLNRSVLSPAPAHGPPAPAHSPHARRTKLVPSEAPRAPGEAPSVGISLRSPLHGFPDMPPDPAIQRCSSFLGA